MVDMQSRFWSNVNKNGPVHSIYGQCWEWTGCLLTDGYGIFSVFGLQFRAHRFSWYLYTKVIPTTHVLHHCDNRKCVNPTHLFLGNNQDNIADKCSKGRQHNPKGVLNGRSILTEEEVREIRRICKPNSRINGAAAIARRLGVCKSAVSRSLKGKSWSHLT